MGWHLTAYDGRDDGIFRAGIMESGNPVNYNSYKTDIEYQPKFNELLNATNCTEALDRLDCLRKVPVETIQNIFNTTSLSRAISSLAVVARRALAALNRSCATAYCRRRLVASFCRSIAVRSSAAVCP